MGASRSQDVNVNYPAFNAGLAQNIIKDAIEKQRETTTALQQRGELYKQMGQQAQYELERTFGRSGAEALQNYEQAFVTGIPAIQAEFEKKQKQDPEILSSKSFSDLTNVLRSAGKEYTTAMRGATDEAASRLYQALTAPIAGFESVANKPTFNKLYDPTYMNLASKPPTVQSDVESFKPLYTYNV